MPEPMPDARRAEIRTELARKSKYALEHDAKALGRELLNEVDRLQHRLDEIGEEATGQWSVRYRDSDGNRHEWVRPNEYTARRILTDLRKIDPGAEMMHCWMTVPRVVDPAPGGDNHG
jgi:hypothetical protein